MRTSLMLLVLSTVSAAASLSLTPSQTMPVQPGDFIGWSYVLSDSQGYAVPTFSEFNPPPDTGLYIDFAGLPINYVVVSPLTPSGQDYDQMQQAGIGELFIDPATIPGSSISGTITLHYDLYSKDPNADPGSFLSGDHTVSTDVTIGVAAATGPQADAPEPSTLGLMLAGIVLCCLARVRRAAASSYSK